MAVTWLWLNCRPVDSLSMTEALGARLSRKKTDFSPSARWTRTASTPSICLIVSINSCSRAARSRSPSSVRLAPSGSLSRLSLAVSGVAKAPFWATSARAL